MTTAKLLKPLKLAKVVTKSQRLFKASLTRFFKTQKNRFIKSGIISEIYNKYPVRVEWIDKYLDMRFDFRNGTLYNILKSHFLKEFNDTKVKQGEPKVKDLPLSVRKSLHNIAIDINTFTRKSLVKKIQKSCRSKHEITKARSTVKSMFDGMSDYRAERIMKTELNRAKNESFMHSLEELGVLEHKKWIDACGEGCPICKANEAKGWIPINDKFPSGHQNAPSHVNCDCVIVAGI